MNEDEKEIRFPQKNLGTHTSPFAGEMGRGTGRFVTGVATAGGRGAVTGCISFDRFRGFFEPENKRDQFNVLTVNAFHNIDRHMTLSPGESLVSEWIYADWGWQIRSKTWAFIPVSGSTHLCTPYPLRKRSSIILKDSTGKPLKYNPPGKESC